MHSILAAEIKANGITSKITAKRWLTPVLFEALEHSVGDTFSEKIYLIANGRTEKEKCGICGKPRAKFISQKVGYRQSCSSSCESTKLKIQRTCVERFGVPNPFQSDFIKDKIADTVNERYGGSFTKTQAYREQTERTCITKYNTQHHSQNSEIKRKSIQTRMERYGVQYSLQNPDIQAATRVSYNQTIGDRLTAKFIEDFELLEYTPRKSRFLCRTCDSVFTQKIYNGKAPRCYFCFPPFLKKEREFVKAVSAHFSTLRVITNDRSVIAPKEIDLWFPELGVGIEFDGQYWHSFGKEENVPAERKFHLLNKQILADSKGVIVLHVQEQEWDRDPSGVLEKIKNAITPKLPTVNIFEVNRLWNPYSRILIQDGWKIIGYTEPVLHSIMHKKENRIFIDAGTVIYENRIN